MFCLNELLHKLLNERNPVESRSPSAPCYHSWEVKQDCSFIEMVTHVWQSIFAVDTAERAQCMYEQLHIIEYPPSTINTHPRQVVLCMICVACRYWVASTVSFPQPWVLSVIFKLRVGRVRTYDNSTSPGTKLMKALNKMYTESRNPTVPL